MWWAWSRAPIAHPADALTASGARHAEVSRWTGRVVAHCSVKTGPSLQMRALSLPLVDGALAQP